MELKDLYQKNREAKKATGQYNVYNYEMIKGVTMAAKEKNTPVLIGTSPHGVKLIGMDEINSIVNFYKERLDVPIFINLDHGREVDTVKKAIDLGYDGVHFDGSELDFEDNIQKTKEIVSYAKDKDVLIEGEIELIGSETMTDPEKAAQFVKETNINSLAVNIGNRHGIADSGTNPSLKIERLIEIAQKIPEIYLVLHGGSGTPVEDLKKAISKGIVKVNFATELKNTYVSALQAVVENNSGSDILYNGHREGFKAIKAKVEEKFKLLS